MRQMRRRQQQWRVFLFTVLLVACALAITRYAIHWTGHLGANRQPVTSPGSPTVESGTQFLWVTGYSLCGDEDRRQEPPVSAAIGQTEAELKAANPGWTVETFSRERVVLRRTEQFCPLHRDSRTLKINGDTLVIYYGTPDRLGPQVSTVPDVIPASLADEDRANLLHGMLFQSSDQNELQDQIQAYLEGITE